MVGRTPHVFPVSQGQSLDLILKMWGSLDASLTGLKSLLLLSTAILVLESVCCRMPVYWRKNCANLKRNYFELEGQEERMKECRVVECVTSCAVETGWCWSSCLLSLTLDSFLFPILLLSYLEKPPNYAGQTYLFHQLLLFLMTS